ILTINSIIYGELLFMVENSLNKIENRDSLEKLIENLTIYSLDKCTSEIYGQFRAEIINKLGPKEKKARRNFKLKEVGIFHNDLWIACTAIQHNLIIVSEDRDFKQMCKVRSMNLECWK
ncbi:MAG: type II toxin-antitoxin system VapC family toxin, partial [Rhizonema sp. PD37]|nr:type II toxin-antitoxin system VapC family toxin [Rhizonema sp. PD37]